MCPAPANPNAAARLKPATIPGVPGPVVVAIMDGVGIGRGDDTDAVATAHTPNLDAWSQGPLVTTLAAHGRAVGMPSDGDMGNSEVGHNALGAGRVFDQGAKLVQEAIASGAAFQTPLWQQMVGQCTSAQKPLHLIGLLSDGNVHSHIDHVIALIKRAHSDGVRDLFVHVLLDGRDVPKTSAHAYLEQLEAALAPLHRPPERNFQIASGGGRMHITMDRYGADWPMVERGWNTHVRGLGRGFANAREALATYRSEHPGITDQDLPAFVIQQDGKPVGPISDGACVLAFNFRGDRMLELCAAFEASDAEFPHFDRSPKPDVLFAGMTLYDGDSNTPRHFLVAPPQIEGTLGELLCEAGVSQLACSETQKFGHVTYFFNGNRSEAFDPKLERYVEIPSFAPPFDGKPQMRAPEIAQAVVKDIAQHGTRFIRLNLANGDMVGHTGDFEATVEAMQHVDAALGTIAEIVLPAGGAIVVTADHGNADDMAERDKHTGAPLRDGNGRYIPKTSHSLNPVPFYVVTAPNLAQRYTLSPAAKHAGLGNVAATCAMLLGYEPPSWFLPSIIEPAGQPR